MHLILEEGLLTPHGVTEKFTLIDSSIEFTSVNGLNFYKVDEDDDWTMTAGNLRLRSLSGALLKHLPEFDRDYVIFHKHDGEGSRVDRLSNFLNNMSGEHSLVPFFKSKDIFDIDSFYNPQDGLAYDVYTNSDYILVTPRDLEGDDKGLGNVIDLPNRQPIEFTQDRFKGYTVEEREGKVEIIHCGCDGSRRDYIGVIGIMKDNKFVRMDNPIHFLNYPNPSEITQLVCDSIKDFK